MPWCTLWMPVICRRRKVNNQNSSWAVAVLPFPNCQRKIQLVFVIDIQNNRIEIENLEPNLNLKDMHQKTVYVLSAFRIIHFIKVNDRLETPVSLQMNVGLPHKQMPDGPNSPPRTSPPAPSADRNWLKYKDWWEFTIEQNNFVFWHEATPRRLWTKPTSDEWPLSAIVEILKLDSLSSFDEILRSDWKWAKKQ